MTRVRYPYGVCWASHSSLRTIARVAAAAMRDSRSIGGLGQLVDADPAVSGLSETNKVIADFLRRFDRDRVTGRVIVQTADDNAHHFAPHVQQRRPSLTSLGGNIHAQMDRRKITAEIFPVESCDHPEIGRLLQIQWETDRYDRRCNFQLFGFTNRQGWSGLFYF